jgi:hypothetical protein
VNSRGGKAWLKVLANELTLARRFKLSVNAEAKKWWRFLNELASDKPEN